jgi:hypothetical protein
MEWLSNLTPIQIAEFVGGIVILIIVAKYTGLSYSKEKGLCFKSNQKSDSILETVMAIKASDEKQSSLIGELSGRVNNNMKDVLRLTFYNTALHPAERLVAGKRYLDAGGNGPTQEAINALAAEYPAVWEGIIAVSAAQRSGL